MIIDNLPVELKSQIASAEWEAVRAGKSDTVVYRLRDGAGISYLKVSLKTAQYPVAMDYQRLLWLRDKVPVPDVLQYAENETHQYLLMSDCAGLHPFHDDLHLEPEERIQVLAESARVFHSVSIDDCPFQMSTDDQIALVEANIEAKRVRIHMPESELQSCPAGEVFQELLELKPATFDPVLTHGDLYPVNIRIDAESHQVSGYIDAGMVAVADRYTDFACIVNAISWHYDKQWIDRFFELYGVPVDREKLRFYQLFQEFM